MAKTTALLIPVLAAAILSLDRPARADDVAVSAKKLVIIDKTAVNGTAKIVYVSKDGASHKGASGAPQTLTGTLDVFYADDDTNRGTYSLPAVGWEENDATLAKYKNTAAPTGGGVKIAMIKPGTLAKVVGKSLGDASSIDVNTAPGAGGIMVVLTITNSVDTSVHRMCTLFANTNGEIDHKVISGGLGRRIVAKNAVAAACPETVAESVPADTTVDTDTEADGATPEDPLETAVTSPNGGSVVIKEGPPAGTPPEGFVFIGQQSDITAPAGSPDDPLTLGFLLDLSVLPAGEHESNVAVFRDGVLVQPCIGAPGVPSPDPCVAERTVDGDDLRLTILSAHASRWTFGLPPCACLPGGSGVCTGGQLCKTTCQCAPVCDCCANNPGTYEFTSTVGAGTCGTATTSTGSTFANLACNGFYFGGGQNSGASPATLPDQVKLTMNVTSCNASTERLELAAAPAAQTGSNRNCTAAGCLFGPPIPVPNSATTPISWCLVSTVAQPATGTASCDGSAQITLPLRGEIFLTGDTATDPSGTIAGIQPCPLCSGGTCRGGANNGMSCVPASSALGASFPTSHDCPPDPMLSLGTISVGTTLTSGVAQAVGAPSGTQTRVFCGFCRDADATGGFGRCIGGGTPGAGCGNDSNCSPGTCGGPVKSCVTDADCAGDQRESCEQRSNGAFGPNGGAVKTITLTGSQAGCLADGNPHASTLVGGGCIEPTLVPTYDAVHDMPGPTALSLQGSALLGGPVPTTTTSTSSTVTTTTSSTTTTLGGCCNSNSFYNFSSSGIGGGDCGDLLNANGTLASNLSCNSLYLGGGGNSIPLPRLFPDGQSTVLAITSCTGQSATLGATTSVATGSNLDCSNTGCLFGAPVPVANANSTPTSHCVVHIFTGSATGTLDCATGAEQLNMPLAEVYYLTGDTATDPGGTIAGIQPCPLCSGGSCIGGPNSGFPCTPDTSNLGSAYPTSQDCPPAAGYDLGTIPFSFAMSSGTVTWSGTVATNDTGSTVSNQSRVFSGFCRDADGSGCFDGDPDTMCPASSPGFKQCWENGMAVGAACSGTFESCEQRTNGAFGPNGGSIRTIVAIGTPQSSILSGPSSGALAVLFAVPPFSTSASANAALDYPGPGALVLGGTGQLCATASPCP